MRLMANERLFALFALAAFAPPLNAAEPTVPSLGKPDVTIRLNENTAGTFAWMPDSQHFMSSWTNEPLGIPPQGAKFKPKYRDRLIVWNADTRRIKQEITEGLASQCSPRLSVDGNSVVRWHVYNYVQLVKLKEKKSYELWLSELNLELQGPGLSLCPDIDTISPEGDHLVYGNVDGVVVIDVPKKHASIIPKSRPTEFAVHDLGFSQDGKTLFGRHYDVVEIWEWPSRKLLRTIKVNEASPKTLQPAAISSDGSLVCCVLDDMESFTVWNTKTGEKVSSMRSKYVVDRIEFVPGTNLLATTPGIDVTAVTLWDGKNGIAIGATPPVPSKDAGMPLIAPSPDGKRLAAYNLKVMQIWDISAYRDGWKSPEPDAAAK
jgi:WD40 repeat protein